MNKSKIAVTVLLVVFVCLTLYFAKTLIKTEIAQDSIRGNIAFKNKEVLPDNSRLKLELVESGSTKIITNVSTDVSRQSPPIKYNLSYNKKLIANNSQYGIRASIEANGETLWSLEKPQTVISYGEQVASTDITLEKLKKSEPKSNTCPTDTFTCENGNIVNRVPPSCNFDLCESATTTTSENTNILETTWVWQHNSSSSSEDFALSFSKADQTFVSSTDCNQISGAYTISENTISFSNIAMTKMLCPDSLDQEYANNLERVQSFTVKQGLLQLFAEDTLMEFEANN